MGGRIRSVYTSPSRRCDRFPARIGNSMRRTTLILSFALAALMLPVSLRAVGQWSEPTPTNVLDPGPLKPPPGARVAIVEFADMECPACAHANVILKAAAAQYKIPRVRHDFLIPFHTWSPTAAVNARWFDTKSERLGNEYRDQVFANQRSFFSPDALQKFTQEFAKSHGVILPYAIDPEGKLAALVKADTDLENRTGTVPPPPAFVVPAYSKGALSQKSSSQNCISFRP